MDINEVYRKFEKLARDWLEFSQSEYGWNSRKYYNYVDCYFADSSRHRAATFGEHGCEIQVHMHSEPQFGSMTAKFAKSADEVYEKASNLLDLAKAEEARRSEEEKQSEKNQAIATLRERLAELEARAFGGASGLTPAELRTLGDNHGWGWQTRLARALPVNVRTVRRWLAGKTKIHPALAVRVRELLKRNRPNGQKEEA